MGNAANPVVLLTQKPDGHMNVRMENVLFIGNRDKGTVFKMDGQTELYTKNCSFLGLDLLLRGKKAHMENTVLSGINSSIFPENTWEAKKNIYSFNQLSVNDINYSAAAKNLREYKDKSGDNESVWINKPINASPVKEKGITAGADITKMKGGNETLKKYRKEAIGFKGFSNK
jgi:hypothetical protein